MMNINCFLCNNNHSCTKNRQYIHYLCTTKKQYVINCLCAIMWILNRLLSCLLFEPLPWHSFCTIRVFVLYLFAYWSWYCFCFLFFFTFITCMSCWSSWDGVVDVVDAEPVLHTSISWKRNSWFVCMLTYTNNIIGIIISTSFLWFVW